MYRNIKGDERVAVKRGLNKAKGLGSLFPQNYAPARHEPKLASEDSPDDDGKRNTDRGPSEEKSASRSAAKPGKSGSVKKNTKKVEPQSTEEAEKDDRKSIVDTNDISETGDHTSDLTEFETDPEGKSSETSGGVVEVRISEVVPNKDQPRTDFDEASLEELTESIRQFGVIQPLLVQKKGKFFEIIAGERRWRAARRAGLKTLPVVIRDYSEKETVEISLIENIQRQDLNSIEEAKAYRRLLDEFGMTQDEVAKRVSKSRTAVTNSVRLLNLEEHVQKMVINGDLSAGHARALLGLSEPELQHKAAEEVVRGELSVRETELLVKELLKPKKEKREKKVNEQLEAVYHEMENRLTEQIGTKVRILHGRGKRGKIEIEYYSQDDLNRIIDLIH